MLTRRWLNKAFTRGLPFSPTIEDFHCVSFAFNTEFFTSLLDMQWHTTPGIGITFKTPTSILEHLYFATVPNDSYVTGFSMIEERHAATISPDRLGNGYKQPLMARALLSMVDDCSYVGNKFMLRSVAVEKEVECGWAGEVFTTLVTEYRHAYMTEPQYKPETGQDGARVDDRLNYNLVVLTRTAVTCMGHKFGKKDNESPVLWEELLLYLRDNVLPPRCANNTETKKFLKRAQ
jgi:hypothetical protein